MTTRYVGIGGNNASDGLSWANRKLTLNGVEDTPVEAGDTVYVGPGTYREMLTVDVSGSAEAGAISYIGDYTGANTDGTGGVVRITGSDNDQSAARDSCIYSSGKNYRRFSGVTMDTVSTRAMRTENSDNWIIEKCYLASPDGGYGIGYSGGTYTNLTIRNCYLYGADGIYLRATSAQDDCNILIENCIFTSKARGVYVRSLGGALIKNCLFSGCYNAVEQAEALTAGQTVVVNNCVINGSYKALLATTTGLLVENYNTFYCVGTARTNVNVGANSVTYPPLFDSRWFHEMVDGGSILSPFDLASYSQLVNLAGTSPTTADMRGTTVQGSQREWGALEYDSTLDIEAGAGGGLLTHPGMTAGMRG